jgi:hypothetical protein
VLYEHSINFALRESIATSEANAPKQQYGRDLIGQLRELGMTDDERDCLLAMKYYISKSATSRKR